MSDQTIKSMIGWWYKLVVAGTISAYLGVVVFIRTGINAGVMSGEGYTYAIIVGLLALIGLVWLKAKLKSAPAAIEGFLRRLGLYKAS
jgi:hypothetical protein